MAKFLLSILSLAFIAAADENITIGADGSCIGADSRAVKENIAVTEQIGKTRREAICKNGKLNGEAKTYYENDAPMIETSYKNGAEDGLRKEFFESGGVKREISFKEGKPSSAEKIYFEDGSLRVETPYRGGRRHGLGKIYRKNGKLLAAIEYQNGLAVSGACHEPSGIKTPLTIVEIIDWHNGIEPECE